MEQPQLVIDAIRHVIGQFVRGHQVARNETDAELSPIAELPRTKFPPERVSLLPSLNTIVLGRILEKIAGESFDELLRRERLLKPRSHCIGRSSMHRRKTRAALLPRLYRLLPEHAATNRHVRVAPVLFCGRRAPSSLSTCIDGVSRWGRIRPNTNTSPGTHRRRARLGVNVPAVSDLTFGHAGSGSGLFANVQYCRLSRAQSARS
jgi:hypothetical protein